jgi:hypothetical protein
MGARKKTASKAKPARPRSFRATFRRADGGIGRLLVERAGGISWASVVLHAEAEDPDGRRHWRRETHDDRAAQLLGLIVVGVYVREE